MIHGHGANEYYHDGRNYIEGKKGGKFSLRMKNNSSERALFIPTVDGLSIMNGKEASYKSRGYIVDAYDSTTITGWRTSDDKVAEFFFAAPGESYATKVKKDGNIGVIGCAVFKEKEKEKIRIVERIVKEKEYIPYPAYPPYPYQPHWWFGTSAGGSITYTSSQAGLGASATCLSASNTGGAQSVNCMYSAQSNGASGSNVKEVNAGLGTGFGQEVYSPVTTVSFDKEDHPAAVFTLYYNTRDNLAAMGVEFKKAVYVAPSAFPNEDGYCARP